VLHVYKDPWAGARSVPDTANVMPDFRAQYQAAIVKKLEAFAPNLAHELRASKATFHAVSDDSHAHGIVKFANHISADLIIMGSRGHSRLRELVFGSTVEKAVREALCSALVVR
jgi:nucleotide-binding universal stress UspA family protein